MSTHLAPVARLPLSLEIASRLREAIVAGDLPAGDELPTESDLASTFGVGRSTVREALRVLQSQGLVTGAESVSTSRPRVTHDRLASTAASALTTALRVSAVALPDLVGLRVLLERDAIESVGEVPAAARECLATMRAAAVAGDIEAFHLADVDFHVSLSYAGGNAAVGLVVEVMRGTIAGYLRTALADLDDPVPVLQRLCDEHEAIVAALDADDRSRAGELVVAHIRGFYEPEVER